MIENAGDREELPTDIDIDVLCADRPSGDHTALDEQVGRPPHDLAILERTRLALIGIGAQVVRTLGLGGHEAPLDAGRETGPSASPQPRFLHDLGDLLGFHRQRLAESLVAATLEPAG